MNGKALGKGFDELFPELLAQQKIAPRQKTMTVKEVAESLGVADVTVNQNVAKLFPGLAKNGVKTHLNEEQVTAIKNAIQKSGRTDLVNVHKLANITTDLEMEQRAVEVMAWQLRKIQEMRERLSIVEPLAQVAEKITNSGNLRTVTDFGKIIGIGPRRIFDALAEKEIIFRSHGRWQPFAYFVDQGYFVLRETTYTDSEGREHTAPQMYLTGKGEVWLASKFQGGAA